MSATTDEKRDPMEERDVYKIDLETRVPNPAVGHLFITNPELKYFSFK